VLLYIERRIGKNYTHPTHKVSEALKTLGLNGV
jgi:hypothetical protein